MAFFLFFHFQVLLELRVLLIYGVVREMHERIVQIAFLKLNVQYKSTFRHWNFYVANRARPSLYKNIFKGSMLLISTYSRQSNLRPSLRFSEFRK